MKNRQYQMRQIPAEKLPAIEVLIASLCYLMTQYAREPDVALAPRIRQHLHLLEQHPDCDSELLRAMCRRLASHWLSLTGNQPDDSCSIQFIH